MRRHWAGSWEGCRKEDISGYRVMGSTPSGFQKEHKSRFNCFRVEGIRV